MREELLAIKKQAKKPRPHKLIQGEVIVRPDCFEPQLAKKTEQQIEDLKAEDAAEVRQSGEFDFKSSQAQGVSADNIKVQDEVGQTAGQYFMS